MTKLDIWNAALALLPHDIRVLALDEDSTEAQRCRENWDGARRKVLAAREWGALAIDIPACGPGPVYRPANALRVVGLVDARGRRIRSTHSNGALFAVCGFAAALRYIPDVDDPEAWPPAVQDAVVAELAARLCPVLTDNAAREADLRQEAERRIMDAGELDANESGWSGTDGMSFIRARG